MATTLQDLKGWFAEGQRQGAHHMVVVCDTFDHDDYPVYVSGNDTARQVAADYSKNMQRVMEVYDLTKPFPTTSGRVFDYE